MMWLQKHFGVSIGSSSLGFFGTKKKVADEKKVEKKVEEKKPAEKRTYSSYDSDDSRYLRTYRNRYSGTKAKPHSHMSCLQRMLSRFSRYNREIRTRRQTRNSSLSGRK